MNRNLHKPENLRPRKRPLTTAVKVVLILMVTALGVPVSLAVAKIVIEILK